MIGRSRRGADLVVIIAVGLGRVDVVVVGLGIEDLGVHAVG